MISQWLKARAIRRETTRQYNEAVDVMLSGGPLAQYDSFFEQRRKVDKKLDRLLSKLGIKPSTKVEL